MCEEKWYRATSEVPSLILNIFRNGLINKKSYLLSCRASPIVSYVAILQSRLKSRLTVAGISSLMSTSHSTLILGLDTMFFR